MTAPTVTHADHLLAELRTAFNLAEHACSDVVRDEAYRTAACAAVALDRHVTLGGEPPTAWQRNV